MFTFLGISALVLLLLAWEFLGLIARLFGLEWPSFFKTLWDGEGDRPLTKQEKDWFYQQEQEKHKNKK